MRRFMEYPWPGNIRELENTMKRIVVLGSEDWVGEELVVGAAPDEISSPEAEAPRRSLDGLRDFDALRDFDGLGLKEIGQRAVAIAERIALQRVLGDVRWNRMEAARRLKVNYKTVLSKIEKYGIGRGGRDSTDA
jgi:DNA-binding NtrC family response regulator